MGEGDRDAPPPQGRGKRGPYERDVAALVQGCVKHSGSCKVHFLICKPLISQGQHNLAGIVS
jgi:hypothetical protein